MDILYATIVMTILGGILGLVLAFASRALFVKVDIRIETVKTMLPGLDCGACGQPGCEGLSIALISGKETKVSACKPSKLEQRLAIQKYLAETPGPDGKTLKVAA